MEVPLDPRRVVDHRVHRIGGVDGAAEAAEREGHHRQGHAREERIAPRQHADPTESASAAASAPGQLERRDHREGGHQTRKHDRVGGERVNELPAARDARISKLMVEPHWRREQHELHEHHARHRVAEEFAAGDFRNHRVPEHVSRQQPEVGQRMPEPPEVGASHDRVDAIDIAERPRQDEDQHLDCQSGGGQNPDRHRREHAVHRQRHPLLAMCGAPGTEAADHHAAPHPRANDE